jgi:uncharacterized LabA/DUF88 family protein
MLDRSRRVVLLVDYDNLQICASRDTPGRELQLVPVVQLAQRYGTVIEARAYAEWNLSTERLAVYKAGLEPAFAPVLRTESDRSGKSLADTVMVADGMDMLWTLSPDVLVLATSDKDLIPLVRVAKQRGAHVVVLGSDFTAKWRTSTSRIGSSSRMGLPGRPKLVRLGSRRPCPSQAADAHASARCVRNPRRPPQRNPANPRQLLHRNLANPLPRLSPWRPWEPAKARARSAAVGGGGEVVVGVQSAFQARPKQARQPRRTVW